MMTKFEFAKLIHGLGDAWTRSDYDAVCSAFHENVHYADPLRYSFKDLVQLRDFFEAGIEDPQQSCVFHAVVFDEDQQLGAAEYTYAGKHQYHGLVLVKIRGKKISHWREYQHIDDRSREAFVASTKF